MPTKAELRRLCRAERDALPQTQVEADSERIREQVLALPEIIAARRVFLYASTASEVQTYTLIEDLLALGKTVALPRITDPMVGQMQAIVIHSLKDLTPAPAPGISKSKGADRQTPPHQFGILTPRGHESLDPPAEVVILPGLAFSPDTGVRLGTGGGYYDRFLSQPAYQHAFRIGLAFESQLHPALPAESHDQPVHAIATPQRIHRVTPAPR